MVTKEIADRAWSAFSQVVKGYIPLQEEKIAQAWDKMSKQSSQKRLMLQKQNALRARMRCL